MFVVSFSSTDAVVAVTVVGNEVDTVAVLAVAVAVAAMAGRDAGDDEGSVDVASKEVEATIGDKDIGILSLG